MPQIRYTSRLHATDGSHTEHLWVGRSLEGGAECYPKCCVRHWSRPGAPVIQQASVRGSNKPRSARGPCHERILAIDNKNIEHLWVGRSLVGGAQSYRVPVAAERQSFCPGCQRKRRMREACGTRGPGSHRHMAVAADVEQGFVFVHVQRVGQVS